MPFSLLSPALLAGLALVALPVAAHLLNRRARRRVVFPSVELLAAARASHAAPLKLRRWLLLALRALAVTAAVLAFTRPLWRGAAAAGAAGPDAAGGAGAVLVVLDVSASTAQRTGGTTAFDRLRDQARRELNAAAAAGDAAGLVLAGATARPVTERLTHNIELLTHGLGEAAPADPRADLTGALAAAGALLGAPGAPAADAPRQVVVLTDGQVSNWDGLGTVGLPAGVTLSVRTPDAEPGETPVNAGLARPALRPAVPGVGRPAEVSAELRSPLGPPRRLRVELRIDGQSVDTRWVRTSATGAQRVAFTHRFDRAGPQRVELRLVGPGADDDALAADNTAWLVARPVARRDAVFVGDRNPDRPGTAGYHVTRALAPFGDERDRFRVTHVAGAALTDDALRGAALVCVGEVGFAASESVAAALTRYAASGGAVLVFAGSSPLNAPDLVPWAWAGRMSGAALDRGDWSAPELAAFDAAAQRSLAETPLRRGWAVRDVADDARVLLSFADARRGVTDADGPPALATRPVGAGTVVAAAFSPAADAGELGKYGAFVVLVQSLAEHLATGGSEPRGALAGEALAIPPGFAVDPDGATPAVRGPDDAVVADAAPDPDGGAVLPRADRAGVYRLTQGPAVLSLAAVNLDPRESDLTALKPDALASRLAGATGGRGGEVAVGAAGGATTTAAADRGAPLWGWCVLATLGLLTVESALLAGWRR